MRRVLLVLVLLGVAVRAAPSSATTYYDYWSYWHKPPGATTWQYSKVGPSGYYLKPGTQVEGWRFAIGTASSSDPKPRPADVTYGDYCKDSGLTYQVLLVVDYGTQSGAPSGPVYSCYGFDAQPSGLTVLTKQHSERDSGGLICAIDSYPKSGCGDVVSSPAPTTTRSTTPASTAPATRPPAAQPTTHPRVSTSHATVSATASATTRSAPAASRAATAATTTTPSTTATAAGSETPAVVAKQFVPPRRRGGVPFGFVAAGVFVVVLVGAVWWQRRRRAG